MEQIVIIGATGYVGGRLVPKLIEAGYPVRCLVRSPEKLTDREWGSDPNIDIRRSDLSNIQLLSQDLTGCDTAFYLVHSMLTSGVEYARKDLDLAISFAKSAQRAGLKRIIYLGGLGETGENLSEHLSSRRAVETALGTTGVPVTVLRAAMIIGSGSASFEILRYLVHRLPVMITPKWVTTKCQPIAVENVLTYLVGMLKVPGTAGQIFDIGGSEVLPYSEIMRVMAEELKLPRRIVIPVPFLTPRLSSYWIHLVTPLSYKIARPLAEGLKNPVVCREDRITKLVPQRLLNIREAIHAALSQVEAMEVETNWSMAGPIPGDPDWSGGKLFRDSREAIIDAPDSSVFRAICRLGGTNGWSAKWLWRIRGWMDHMAGGPGLRRGRRDPNRLRFGDALDFWRVVGIESNRHLALRAEMRLPGIAMLDFRIEPAADGKTKLNQNALFQPRGLLGLIYWWCVFPFHHFVFQRMLKALERDAMNIARRDLKPVAIR